MNCGPLAKVLVDNAEQLARFVLTERHIRKSDGTVKAEALIPSPHAELSVTRHRDLTDEEIWTLGEKVAALRRKPLIGRADFLAADARQQKLDVKPDEPPHNHANVLDWPSEKALQMAIALEVSTRTTFVALPT